MSKSEEQAWVRGLTAAQLAYQVQGIVKRSYNIDRLDQLVLGEAAERLAKIDDAQSHRVDL